MSDPSPTRDEEDALHMALRSMGVPHSGSVTVAISRLIDAKIDARRAEELEQENTSWAKVMSGEASTLIMPRPAEHLITPMDRRAAELGNPEARERVALADGPRPTDQPRGCCAGGAISEWAGSPCESCPRRPAVTS